MGGLKKKCPACQASIFNGCKLCPICKAPQPHKVRQKKKLDNFNEKKKTWVANTKKNQLTSHLMDDALILIEKLNAVGWSPILLLEYPKKETQMILPEGLRLSGGESKCLHNIKEIFTLMVEARRGQSPPTDSNDLPGQAEEGEEGISSDIVSVVIT